MNPKEQADAIESAIVNVMGQLEEAKDDVLVEWILVSYVDSPIDNNSGGYAMWVSNGTIPDHRALGLLTKAIELVNHGHEE